MLISVRIPKKAYGHVAIMWKALVVSLCCQISAASELQERSEIIDAAYALFVTSDFNTLEELSARYRETQSRTSSGVWHLALYYQGLSAAINDTEAQSSSREPLAEAEDSIAHWLSEFPESPSANIAQAMMLVARAWKYRGEDFARNVREEAWEPYERNLALAREHLGAQKATAARDPHWYKVMLWVAKGQGWHKSEFAALLDEAIAREPLYTSTYFSAQEHLLPKWHGSIADIEAFAQVAAQRTRTRAGDEMYARIYWHASVVEYQNDLFSDTLVDWPTLKQGFEDLIDRYPDPWNLNNYARFACLARDKDKSRELFERIRDDFISEAWDPPSSFTECTFWQLLP